MSTKAVLVDFGLSVQMTEDVYFPKDLRGTEVIMFPQEWSIFIKSINKKCSSVDCRKDKKGEKNHCITLL